MLQLRHPGLQKSPNLGNIEFYEPTVKMSTNDVPYIDNRSKKEAEVEAYNQRNFVLRTGWARSRTIIVLRHLKTGFRTNVL